MAGPNLTPRESSIKPSTPIPRIHPFQDSESEQSPPPFLNLFLRSLPPRLLLDIQIPQPLHLPQHQLQQLLAPDNLQMRLNLRILPREPLDLVFPQAPPEPDVEFAGEGVEEFGEQLDVEEEDCRAGEFGGHDVQEDFRALVFRFPGRALFGFQSCETHAEEGGAGA